MPPQQIHETEDGLREPLLSEDDQLVDTTTNRNDTFDKDIILRSCCCIGNNSSKRINHNVFFNILLSASVGISQSLWNGTAYVAYLKKLGHDQNGPLGDIEAISGFAQLVMALPVGYVADKWGRSKVISIGGIVRFFTILVQVGVMTWVGDGSSNTTEALIILGAVMWFWGVGDGIVNGPCAALYADSTAKGERSAYFNYLFNAGISASVVGPLVSIALFQFLGDDWGFSDLRIVIYVGLGFEVFNSICMLCFDDKKALEEEEEEEEEGYSGGLEFEEESESESGNNSEEESGMLTTSLLSPNNNDSTETLKRRQKWIPYIIFVQDLVYAFGSGMTIKFFPLFFKDEIGMTPSQVQIIYCAVPFALVMCSTLCTKIAATGFGRVQTQLLCNFLGIVLLYSMVFCKASLQQNPMLLIPIYIFRTGFMNASYPLQESILMDFVPKDSRARWKSLDSVASFGWCGSAALGGWLADKYDYTYTFLITAILQSAGLTIWALLLPLVPRHEKKKEEETEVEDSNHNGWTEENVSSNP